MSLRMRLLRARRRLRGRFRRRYDVFVSYSHRIDRGLAPGIQAGLERLAKPWYRRHALRVFRDATDLGASPALWPAIRSALVRSTYFVLLASPEAAASGWVQREVTLWLRLHGTRRLLVVVTAGADPVWSAGAAATAEDDPIPAVLRDAAKHEPIWVDVRPVREHTGFTRDNEPFRSALAQLVGPIRGMTPAEIIGEDYRQFRRTIRTAWAAASTLVVLLAATLWMFGAERRARTLAELRLADAFVFQSRQSAAQRDWDAARTLLAQSRAIYSTLERSSILADAASWLLAQEVRQPARSVLLKGRRFTSVGMTCDAGVVVAGDEQGALTFWNTQDGRVTQGTSNHGGRVSDVRVVGRRVFTAGSDGRILEWDVGSKNATTIAEVGVPITALDVDDGLFAAGLADGRIMLLGPAGIRSSFPAHDSQINAVRFTSNGGALVSVSRDNTARIWTRSDRSWIATRELRQPGPVQDVAVLPGVEWVFIANANGAVHVVGASGNDVRAPNVARDGLMAVAVSPDGHFGASADLKGHVALWDPSTGASIAELAGHTAAVRSTAFSCDGTALATAGNDGLLAHWLTAPSRVVRHARLRNGGAILLANSALLSWDAENVVTIWDPDGTSHRVAGARRAPVTAAAAQGGLFATARADGDMTAYDLATRAERWSLRTGCTVIGKLAFDELSRTIAAACGGRSILTVDVATGEMRAQVATAADTTALAIAADGTVVVGRHDGALAAISRNGEERQVRRHDGPVTAVHVADGRVLSAGADGTVKLSMLANLDDSRTMRVPGHLDPSDAFGGIVALAATDRGRIIVAVTNRFRVGLWETEFGHALFSRVETLYHGFNTGVASASILPDGRSWLAVSDDGVPTVVTFADTGSAGR